jgi:hypothetical protein
MRSSGGIIGSGGVACFVRDSLWSRISLVATDKFVRFMWVQVRGVSPLPKDIFIVVCYFHPTSSSNAIHNGPNKDPFIDLYAIITQYMVWSARRFSAVTSTLAPEPSRFLSMIGQMTYSTLRRSIQNEWGFIGCLTMHWGLSQLTGNTFYT